MGMGTMVDRTPADLAAQRAVEAMD